MATQGAGHTLGEQIPLTGPDGKTVKVDGAYERALPPETGAPKPPKD